MRKFILIFFVFASLACYAQSTSKDSISLTILPIIDQKDLFNKEIITTLKKFLSTKDNSYKENKYWLKSDFEKYISPYSGLSEIEKGRLGKDFYKPSLMEIIPTESENKKIVKVAFIGHNNETNGNVIKAIYNIVAIKQRDGVIFSKYLDYITHDWEEVSGGSITYKISPCKTINNEDILKQKNEVSDLCKFLNTKPIPITYYSCKIPKEVFELKGFDYNLMMYINTSGGFAEDRDIVYQEIILSIICMK